MTRPASTAAACLLAVVVGSSALAGPPPHGPPSEAAGEGAPVATRTPEPTGLNRVRLPRPAAAPRPRCLGPERARRLEAAGRLRTARHAALLTALRTVDRARSIAAPRWKSAHERWLRGVHDTIAAQEARDAERDRRAAWLSGCCVGLAATSDGACQGERGAAWRGCWEGRWQRAQGRLDVLRLRHIASWLGLVSRGPTPGKQACPRWVTDERVTVETCRGRAQRGGGAEWGLCEAVVRRAPASCPPARSFTPAPLAWARLEPTLAGPQVAVVLYAPRRSACWVEVTWAGEGDRGARSVLAYTPDGHGPTAVVEGAVSVSWGGLTESVRSRARAWCVPGVPWQGTGGLR